MSLRPIVCSRQTAPLLSLLRPVLCGQHCYYASSPEGRSKAGLFARIFKRQNPSNGSSDQISSSSPSDDPSPGRSKGYNDSSATRGGNATAEKTPATATGGGPSTFSMKESQAAFGPPPPPKGLSRFFTLSYPIELALVRARLISDPDLARLLAKSASVAIYSFAGVTLLGTLGVDTKPLVAGIGITGFTIGFALKEIATNFLSGMLLVFQKPFSKGEHVRILSGSTLEGNVEYIDARYVHLRTKERGIIKIPSAIVYASPIFVQKATSPGLGGCSSGGGSSGSSIASEEGSSK